MKDSDFRPSKACKCGASYLEGVIGVEQFGAMLESFKKEKGERVS